MNIHQVFALCLRPGDTCIDAGANIGMSAEVIAQLVGPTGACHSFECHPIHFTRLAFLASRPEFEMVYPYCRALSDKPGHILLHTGSDPAAAQASTIVTDLGNTQRLGNSIARLKVETDTIDRFCAARDVKPHFIKVDVEGAEEQLFKGARETLVRCHPHVLFEFGYGFTGGSIPAHFTMFTELGYDFFLVDLTYYNGRHHQWADDHLVLYSLGSEDISRTQSGGNILAVHRSRTAMLSSIRIQPFVDIAPKILTA